MIKKLLSIPAVQARRDYDLPLSLAELSFSQEAVVHVREEAVPLRPTSLKPKTGTLASPAFFGKGHLIVKYAA